MKQLRTLGIYCSGPGHSSQTFAYLQRIAVDIAANNPADRVVRGPARYCSDHPKFEQAWRLMRLAEELLCEGEDELAAAKRRRKR